VTDASSSSCDADHGRCITCADEGIPMRVTEVQGGDTAVCVDSDGAAHEIAVDLLNSVIVGDEVLVHAGVAIGARL
jgi:hydrogenase maturation factor